MKHHNFGYADRLGIAISVNGKRFKERLRKEFSEGNPASEDILEVFSAMLEGAQKKWNIPDDFTVMMNKHYFTLEEALKQAENKPLAYKKQLVQVYSQLGLSANRTGIGDEHSAVNKSQFCKTKQHLNASSLRLGPEGFEYHINANFNPNEPRDKDGKWTTDGSSSKSIKKEKIEKWKDAVKKDRKVRDTKYASDTADRWKKEGRTQSPWQDTKDSVGPQPASAAEDSGSIVPTPKYNPRLTLKEIQQERDNNAAIEAEKLPKSPILTPEERAQTSRIDVSFESYDKELEEAKKHGKGTVGAVIKKIENMHGKLPQGSLKPLPTIKKQDILQSL